MKGEYYDALGNLLGIERTEVMVDKNKVGQIVQHYGTQAQKSKAIEELLELSEVLIKDVNKGKVVLDCLYEEMADVYIMLKQLMIIYSIDPDDLQQEIDRKIERTFDRMKCVDPDCGWR